MLDKINIKDGIITCDNISWLKDNNQAKSNIDFLTEDLLQISFYKNEYIIDVGWYPSGRVKGSFIILLINNENWSKPFFKAKTRNINEVYKYIEICIKIIDKKLHLEN
ncbi:hypothetical protein [Acinetobacter lanii]|uniref:Uncharacterized protein n=1 Tax=Acinetobacter lanii TaxID=2715163 RepID=A0A6G8S466_9GAMM|nr:hypothetical protein [Acinetobacter lanii]QIO08924.1 hypothetical protein G8D99_07800 [Acinetobacter lanii]